MSWQSFQRDDRIEQEQLDICRALVEDAIPDTVCWLQADPSAEERVHVVAIQALLTDLDRIIERRMERRRSVRDEWEYAEAAGEVLSRLDEAREVRGNIVGKGLARLAERLPRELPGSKPRFFSKALRPQGESGEPRITTCQSDVWKHFGARFKQFAREEERIERASPKDRLLRAYCDYNEHPEILHEKGKPEQGRFCLLKPPETGLWMYSDGVSENFLERFRALAARAGVTLGSPKGTDPEDFWLHRLYLDLRENNSKLFFFESSQRTNTIRRVCEASATFCSRLERRALETNSAEEQGSRVQIANTVQTEAQASTKRSRLSATINCPSAARRMEAHLKSKAVNQTDFAIQVGTTDRTLRSFRTTGRIRRDIFDAIAKGMETTKEELLKPE